MLEKKSFPLHICKWKSVISKQVFPSQSRIYFEFHCISVKGVNFYGPHSEYIISGSDCGNIFLWDREAEKVVQFFHGDEGGVVSYQHVSIIKTILVYNINIYLTQHNKKISDIILSLVFTAQIQ